MRSYELWLHYKQGDDFSGHLKETSSVSAALRRWAAQFIENQAICERLAVMLDGRNVTGHGDTHLVELCADDVDAEKALAVAAAEELIAAREDDEEDVDDDSIS